MSYSICVLCGAMVPMYEKFCNGCLREHPLLQQDVNYWRTNRSVNWQVEAVNIRAELKSKDSQ